MPIHNVAFLDPYPGFPGRLSAPEKAHVADSACKSIISKFIKSVKNIV